MTLVPFPPPAAPRADSWQFDVVLAKGAETRRFWVRPGKIPGTYCGQIFFGDAQHRACLAEDRHGIARFVSECRREIAAYERDGWTRP